MTGLEIVLRKYIKSHPRSWPNVFQKSQNVRLLNVSYWINDSGLIKESSLKRSVTMEIPWAGERYSAKIMPSFEIQFLDPNTKEWCNLFSIKPSSLVRSQGLRPKAGYGLFAARQFKSGDRIGMYLGEIFEADKFPVKKRTNYSLIFNGGQRTI
jgi:SET domain-containing protein